MKQIVNVNKQYVRGIITELEYILQLKIETEKMNLNFGYITDLYDFVELVKKTYMK